MKYSVVVLALAIVGVSFGQTVPEKALADFSERIESERGSTINSNWEVSENGCKVVFSTNNAAGEIAYDDHGNYRSSLLQIAFEDLQADVQSYVTTNYKMKNVVNSYHLNSGTAPERCVVKIKDKKKIVTIYFRPDGSYHYQE
ncbi:MAG: hypothetical protein H6599_06780 [Flavobacteriales bacterium]|nr:hypothetical protein [Flavobacteriales bacterium]